MKHDLAPAIIAGAASALLFFIVSMFGLGFFFLFLPTLPIFWLGFTRNATISLHAALIAALLLAIIAVPTSGLILYLLCLALPACYIAHESLKSGGVHGLTIWFPITVIMARLMAAFSFVLLGFTLYYSHTAGGIAAIIAPSIDDAAGHFSAELDTQTANTLKLVAPHLAFLVFATTAWIWGGCLYVLAWATNRELVRQNRARRPDMSVSALPPPNWMISLLLIAAVASLIGSESLAFWGKASLIILLFPYFLLGIALLHAHARQQQGRSFLLFFVYLLVTLLIWPVIFIAGYGVFYHVRLLNKYLSGGGNSSRS